MSRKDAKNAKNKNWHGPVLNIILHALVTIGANKPNS